MVNLTEILGYQFDANKVLDKPIANTSVESVDNFLGAIKSCGLIVDHIEEGKIVRCKTTDSKGKQPGWYLYNYDTVTNYAVGIFGDWREGEPNQWTSKELNTLSESERAAIRLRLDAARRAAEAERQIRQDETATKAAIELETFPEAINHDYLARKQIKATHGVRIDPKSKALVVPIVNGEGIVRNYQRINADGSKYFLEDGQVKGCFHFIGKDITKPTYVVEGYATGATVHELTGCSVAVAFNSGNLRPTIDAMREAEPQVQVVVCAENDLLKEDGTPKKRNYGVEAAKKAISGLLGASMKVPQLPPGSTGTDFNDLMIEVGRDEAAKQLGAGYKEKRIQLTRIGDLGQIQPTQWIIKGFLPEESFAGLYGPSGHGKTFVAIDMGMHIATGQDWHGREVIEGNVVYICGEGRRGIQKRVSAWCQSHDVDVKSAGFFVSSRPIPLLDASLLAEFINTTIDMINKSGDVSLVIVDTLNRNFGDGNENSTEDMTKFVDACSEIQRATNASIMVVHHTGLQDATRARGSSALRAAIDVEMRAEQPPGTENMTRLTCTKLKDDEPFLPVLFRRDIVKIDVGDDLIETSCVLVADKDPGLANEQANALLKSAGHKQKQLYQILSDLVEEAQDNNPNLEVFSVERSVLNKRLLAIGVAQNHWSRHIKTGMKKGWLEPINDLLFAINLDD